MSSGLALQAQRAHGVQRVQPGSQLRAVRLLRRRSLQGLGAVVGAGQGSGPDRPHVLQGSIVERQPGGLQGSGGPGFDAEDLILKLGSFGDKKQIVADHCARHKGVSPSPEDVTAIFTPITLSFEAVDVAKALAEHTNMSYPTVVAAVGAATYVGRNDVAAILARDFSPESRQSLMTDVPGLNPRTLGLV